MRKWKVAKFLYLRAPCYVLKEYYEIVGESRPLIGIFVHTFLTEMHF